LKLAHRYRRRFGQSREGLAARYLAQSGLRLLNRNYQCRVGEIDLIARDGETLVFIEVRYRQDDSHGSALESVTPAKQRKIVRCARYFLMKHPQLSNLPCRFDIVGICPDAVHPGIRFDWLRNAFQADS
jgi:putative endonuclease